MVLDNRLDGMRREKKKMEAEMKTLTEKLEEATRVLSKSQILPGTAVRFTGLQRRSDLNGKEAKVVAFDAPSGRYKCLLLSSISSPETIGCKLENVDLRSGNACEEDTKFFYLKLTPSRWRR